MLKKSIFAAVAILAVVLLTACGDSSKSTDTATEPIAPAAEAAVQEGETTTEESGMKITSVKVDANKEVTDEKGSAEEETTTPAAADAAVPAANAAAPAADAAAPAANAAAPAADALNTAPQTNENNAEDEQKKAAEEGTVGTVSVDGDVLSLRGGPSSDNELLDIIPDGTELLIEKEQDGWGYVNYEGTDGWVSMDFIVK